MDGLGNAFASFFTGIIITAVVCFILAVAGLGYFGYNVFFKEKEVITDKKLVPEMKLIIKNNKVDTLWIYKQKN